MAASPFCYCNIVLIAYFYVSSTVITVGIRIREIKAASFFGGLKVARILPDQAFGSEKWGHQNQKSGPCLGAGPRQ